MKEAEALELGTILEGAPEYSWTASLYLQPETSWSKRTIAQVVETDRYTREPAEPVVAGLRRVLSMQDVKGVVLNARAQRAQVSTEELVEALRYYALKDAFINFTRK